MKYKNYLFFIAVFCVGANLQAAQKGEVKGASDDKNKVIVCPLECAVAGLALAAKTNGYLNAKLQLEGDQITMVMGDKVTGQSQKEDEKSAHGKRVALAKSIEAMRAQRAKANDQKDKK